MSLVDSAAIDDEDVFFFFLRDLDFEFPLEIAPDLPFFRLLAEADSSRPGLGGLGPDGL